MRKRLFAATLLLFACGPSPIAHPPSAAPSVAASAPTAAPEQQGWRIVDAMPAWWAFYDKAAQLPRPEQVAMFRRDVVDRYPALFTKDVVGRDPTAPFDLDAQISAWLDDVEPRVSAMRRISASIQQELPQHRTSFERAFPTFRYNGEVYFTISLDAFDGAIRQVAGEPRLLFGVDKIAKIHGDDADLAPLFHHELFHVLHLVTGTPFSGEDNRMYKALWSEGLAVYVAHTLNPRASWKQLVLSDEMVERGTKQLPQLAKEMLENFDSDNEIFYRDWFRGAGQRADIPNRVGYFLGYRVAQRLGRQRSLQQLADLKDPELSQALRQVLSELANEPAVLPAPRGD